jgi:hypothetical protein
MSHQSNISNLDEVSMLSERLFHQVEYVFRHLKGVMGLSHYNVLDNVSQRVIKTPNTPVHVGVGF